MTGMPVAANSTSTSTAVITTVAASIGRRIGAYAIDIAIAYALVGVAGGIAAGLLWGLGAAEDPAVLAGQLIIVWAIVVLVSLAWSFVYTAMQGGRGSIGQRALGVQLRDSVSGARIGFWRALLRNVVWALAAAVVVGYFSPLFDSSGRRQGWHDKVSGSVVIDRRATDAGAAVPAPAPPLPIANPYLPPPPGAEATAPSVHHPALPGVAPAMPTPPIVPAPRAVIPAAPIASSGLIAHVPGISPASPASSAAPPVPPAPSAPPAPQSVAPSSPAGQPAGRDDDGDLDQTRAAASIPAVRPPDPGALVVLTWDDGTRMAVYGRTLYGRNPDGEEGAARVAVRDETLSLSKTHFEVGGDARGPWIIDRHSTNGSSLVRGGVPQRLIAGVQTSLKTGDRLEFGDRSLMVGES